MIIANLKLILRSISKNFFMTMVMMLLFPLVLIHVMTYFNSDMYDQPMEDLNIPIQVVDADKTRESQTILQTLQSQALQGMVVFSDEPDFTIHIPAGYGAALEENTPAVIQIQGIPDASGFRGEILRSMLDTLSASRQTALRLQNVMQNQALLPGDTIHLQQAMSKVQEPSIQAHPYEPEVRINALENFSLQYIQLIFFLFLTSYAQTNKQQMETTDLELRFRSLPVHPLMMQVSEVISSAAQVFLFGFLYIILNRIFAWGFTGNLLQYSIVLFFASIFVATVSVAFTSVIPAKFVSVIGSVLMAFVMLFGGMIGTSQFEGTPFESIVKADISRVLVGPFREVNLGTFHFHSLTLFFLGTVIGMGILYVVERFKKEVLA